MSSIRDESGQSPTTATSTNQQINLTKKEKLIILFRIILMLFFDIVLPLVLYYVLKNYMLEVWALTISGVPPFLVVIYGLITKRRIDILGALIIMGFIVTGIVASLKRDARIQLLRESAVTGTIGLVFLISLLPIKIGSSQIRPMSYYFARDMQTGGSFGSSSKKNKNVTNDINERWERLWNDNAVFRRGYRVLTALWGVGFVLEAPIRIIVIFKAPTVERAFFWTNIITYSWLGVMILLDAIYNRWFKKQIPKGEPTAANQTSV
ncbi:unnamed protein product [Rhizophagus irregularis]|nr:unnamed protein product [Rhizophagus irregularis]